MTFTYHMTDCCMHTVNICSRSIAVKCGAVLPDLLLVNCILYISKILWQSIGFYSFGSNV